MGFRSDGPNSFEQQSEPKDQFSTRYEFCLYSFEGESESLRWPKGGLFIPNVGSAYLDRHPAKEDATGPVPDRLG